MNQTTGAALFLILLYLYPTSSCSPQKKNRVKKSKSKAVTAREGPGSSLRQVAKCWAAIAAVKSQENKDVKSLQGELGGRKSRSISQCLCQVEKGSVS